MELNPTVRQGDYRFSIKIIVQHFTVKCRRRVHSDQSDSSIHPDHVIKNEVPKQRAFSFDHTEGVKTVGNKSGEFARGGRRAQRCVYLVQVEEVPEQRLEHGCLSTAATRGRGGRQGRETGLGRRGREA